MTEVKRLVSPEVFALVKKLEAIVVATRYTLDGEVLVCKRGDEQFDLPLEITHLVDLPEGIKDRHKSAMRTLYQLVEQVRMTDRQVPITRRELLESGVPKKDQRLLEKLGLVKAAVVPLQVAASGERGRPAHCVYFTNKGRAFVREFLGVTGYGEEGREQWESVRERAAELRKIWAAEDERMRRSDRASQEDGPAL